MSNLVKLERDDDDIHRCLWSPKSIFSINRHLFREKFDCSKTLPNYSCQTCQYKTFFVISIKKHLKEAHQSEDTQFPLFATNRKCRKCQFHTHSILNYLGHSIHTGCPPRPDKTFECFHCSHTTKHKYYVKFHILVKHMVDKNVNWFKCNKCEYKAKFKHNLDCHYRRMHVLDKDIQCDRCEYKTKTKCNLKKHVLVKHNVHDELQWFKCDQCDHKTTAKKHLKVHMLKHTAEEDLQWFQCDQCHYRSNRRDNLNSHKYSKHTAEKDVQWFKCYHCNKYASKRKCLLKRHINRMHSGNETKLNVV